MNIKDKALASGIHFSASVLIISLLLFILLTLWYPDPFFTASGGWQGLRLVLLVDLVLGPLLTFIIFNRAKSRREKIIDFSVIISIQLLALGWGIATVYQQRPVAIVFWDDRFYTVPDQALAWHYKKHPEYRQLRTRNKAPLIFARKPANPTEYQAMMQRIQQHDIPPHHQLELYQPFEPAFSSLKMMTLDIKEIITHNAKMREKLKAVLVETNTTLEDNVYLRLESRYQNIVLIFDQTGRQLGFLKAPPK